MRCYLGMRQQYSGLIRMLKVIKYLVSFKVKNLFYQYYCHIKHCTAQISVGTAHLGRVWAAPPEMGNCADKWAGRYNYVGVELNHQDSETGNG